MVEKLKWISVNDQMPETEQRVLAFYKNCYDKKRIEAACYFTAKTIKVEDYFTHDYDDFGEYDEVNDCYWVPEGWYEDSWESETCWTLSEKITHWMPFPSVPENE